MTKNEKINQLIIAIGYALDAGDERKDSERRKVARDKAEGILNHIITLNKLKECRQEPD